MRCLLALSLLQPANSMCVRPPAAELLGRLKPDALAYLGDAVFEVAVRERLMWPPLKMKALNSKTFSYVSAEGQHQILEKVTADFGLTEEELDWLRRGRNASGRGPRRLDPKIYRAASAFETLVGYLYYVDQTRLEQLLQFSLDAAEEVIRVDGEAASSSSSGDSDTAER